MSENRISIAIPSRDHTITVKSLPFDVVDQEGNAVVMGEVVLQMVDGHAAVVLMTTDVADKLLQIYVEKMGITPEMVQEFIDVTKAKMEAKLVDAGIFSSEQEIVDRMKRDNASFLNFPDQAESDGNYTEPGKQTGGLYGGDADVRE